MLRLIEYKDIRETLTVFDGKIEVNPWTKMEENKANAMASLDTRNSDGSVHIDRRV